MSLSLIMQKREVIVGDFSVETRLLTCIPKNRRFFNSKLKLVPQLPPTELVHAPAHIDAAPTYRRVAVQGNAAEFFTATRESPRRGYKVLSLMNNSWFGSYLRVELHLKQWLLTKGPRIWSTVPTTNSSQRYEPYFHIFTTKQSAENYRRYLNTVHGTKQRAINRPSPQIVPCDYADVTTLGLFFTDKQWCEVVIATTIMVGDEFINLGDRNNPVPRPSGGEAGKDVAAGEPVP